jgi:curli biogenesis system outer membrane secretion channel CsgG|tara:strand:- start:491 stop:1423 length:933 start_codon:yes stop_codon:yes gene_type:complete
MFRPLIGSLLLSLAFSSSSFAGTKVINAVSDNSNENIVEDTVKLKRKVAIARFTNETQSGNSFLVNDNDDRIGKQASDILSARLADTGYFLMFERMDSEKTSAEQMLAGLKESGVSVDYLIIGSVSEFGRSTESDTGVFSRKKTQKAYAKVNVRLIEVSSGRIIHAEEGAGEATSETKKTLGAGSSAGYDQSLTDKSISAAISQLTSNLVENMTSKPWRSYLLAEESGSYVIAGGASQGLSEGMQLNVYQSGVTIKNPQTGALITLPGKEVATVSVLATFGDDEFSEVSYASKTSGEIGPDLSKYYITQD